MVCRKSVLEPPSSSQLEAILRDINEVNEERLKHHEQLIQEWIRCQNHFPQNIDRGLVRGMLRGCKHILERTKQKLEHHLAARHVYSDLYSNRSPSSKDIVQAMDVTNIAPMPKLTPKGNRLYFLTLNRHDPAEFNFKNCTKLCLMMFDLLMASDCPCSGEIAIFDAAHFSASHLAQFFGPFFRIQANLLKEAYCIRLKEIHIVNAPPVIRKMTSAIKPLLHAKLRDSIFFHHSPKNLEDIFGKDVLPSNYGGNLKSLREIACGWYDILQSNSEWFEAQENIKITGIPKKVQNKLRLEDQCGIEGSFRKLNID